MSTLVDYASSDGEGRSPGLPALPDPVANTVVPAPDVSLEVSCLF